MLSFDEFFASINLRDHPITEKETASLYEPENVRKLEILGRHGCLLPAYIRQDDLYSYLYKLHYLLNNFKMFNYVKEQFNSSFSKEHYELLLYKALNYEFYTIRNGDNYNILKKAVLSLSDEASLSYESVCQLFRAFEQELFYPCACGTLALIDGSLGALAKSSKTQLVRLLDIATSNPARSPTECIIIPNLRGYLESITRHADFVHDDEPPGLNRHWLLHGRSSYSISRDDCIHLFNAVGMIFELKTVAEHIIVAT